MRGVWATIVALLLGAAPAGATTFAPKDFVCPVGGEAFTADMVASNSTFGARPDGKPYSPLPVVPRAECPGNGFVLFRLDFTPDEIAILSKVVTSPEYEAMRASETQYYRAWVLMDAIDDDAIAQALNLLIASWESDDDPARKTRVPAGVHRAGGPGAARRRSERLGHHGRARRERRARTRGVRRRGGADRTPYPGAALKR